ncbi:MAG TPA: DinB family protein [Vicinamibacterales bacterium]|nr:DinB family protein [Vicinamibacterales bacterium]
MALKDALLPEFDHEMGATRRVLERVPVADLAWKPHDKSFSLGQLAAHVANIPHWIDATLDYTVFDLATIGDDARPKQPDSIEVILNAFDDNVKKARAKLDAQPDGAMLSTWTMKNGDHEILTMPKVAVFRSFIMNHLIHHRGQLTVYLRLRNVPLPALYGPTADEG